MKILGELVEVSKREFYIPWFHRVTPSLQTKTMVHAVLFQGLQPELYLSPFPTASWIDLWQVRCEFHDREGLLAELTELLGRRQVNVNIVAHESTRHQYGDDSIFQVTLICDMTGYGDRHNPDGQSANRAENPDADLQFLRDLIIVEMFNDIWFMSHRPQVFTRRLRDLHSVALTAKNREVSYFKKRIASSMIRVKKKFWNSLFSAQSDSEKKLVTVASDSEERYVRIAPIPADKDVFLVKIEHTDLAGQVAEFAKIIRKIDVRANIICSYLRLQEAGADAAWRCLLETNKDDGKRLKDEIEGEFSNERKTGDERLSVTFPRPLSKEREPIFPNDKRFPLDNALPGS